MKKSIPPNETGYEQGGLVYFENKGRMFVAIVREKASFDKALNADPLLREFVNKRVLSREFEAAKAVAKSLCPDAE